MLSQVRLAARVHRWLLHGLSLAVAAAASMAIASPNPANPAEHLAYGYLYFPLLCVPIVASFSDSPLRWLEASAPRRARALDGILFTATCAAAIAAAALVGWLSADAGAVVVILTNAALALGLLGILLHRMPGRWAWMPVFAYADAGVAMPASPLLLVNREESWPRLVVALVLLGAVCAATCLGWLRRPLDHGE